MTYVTTVSNLISVWWSRQQDLSRHVRTCRSFCCLQANRSLAFTVLLFCFVLFLPPVKASHVLWSIMSEKSAVCFMREAVIYSERTSQEGFLRAVLNCRKAEDEAARRSHAQTESSRGSFTWTRAKATSLRGLRPNDDREETPPHGAKDKSYISDTIVNDLITLNLNTSWFRAWRKHKLIDWKLYFKTTKK